MDFLNQAFAQLKDLYLGMTPGSRITAGLLLVAIVVSLGYIFTGAVSPGETYLFDNRAFTTSETQNMASAFGQAGLNDFDFPEGKVRVPRAQRSDYIAALALYDALPENFGDNFLDVFANASTWESNERGQQRMKAAKERTLADFISGFAGVERAQVIYSTQEQSGFLAADLITAGVTVRPRGSELERKWVAPITGLMVKCIAGLKAENVVITDEKTGEMYIGDQETSFGGAGGGYTRQQEWWEERYEGEYREALRTYPGAIVDVGVVLSEYSTLIEDETAIDPKPVAIQTSETTSKSTSTRAAKSGVPGYLAQQNNGPVALNNSSVAKGDTEEDSIEEISSTSIPSGITTHRETAAHTPTRISVSVSVPESLVEQFWHDDNSVEEGQEPTKPTPTDLAPIKTQISDNIKSLLAVHVRPDPNNPADEPVAVAFHRVLTPKPIVEPGMVENASAWFAGNWSTVGIFGLALFSIVMLRSMIKSTALSDVDRAAMAALVPNSYIEEEDNPAAARAKREREVSDFAFGEGSIKDDVAYLITQDPDTAANILKNWIGPVTAVNAS